MVNFGLLAAEIDAVVWGTPANFNRFRVLAALVPSSGREPNYAALYRGRHLYLAGRPSRWALAHILVKIENGITFLMLAYPGCPGTEPFKQVSVWCNKQQNRM